MRDTRVSPGRQRDDWLSYRVYVASLPEIRDLVERVLQPYLHENPVPAGARWMYLQYVDAIGLQSRFRVHGPHDVLRGIDTVLRPRLESAIADPAVVGGADRDRNASRFVAVRLYEPEYAKYGGRPGVGVAERLMQRGSEAAIALAGPHHRHHVLAYGAAHMLLISHGLRTSERVTFLHHYAWYWSGRGPRQAPWSRRLTTLVPERPEAVTTARRLVAEANKVLAEQTPGRVLPAYARDFWRLVAEARGSRTLGISPWLACFHHLHLMANRLGVTPAQEALIARLLWVDAQLGCGEGSPPHSGPAMPDIRHAIVQAS